MGGWGGDRGVCVVRGGGGRERERERERWKRERGGRALGSGGPKNT